MAADWTFTPEPPYTKKPKQQKTLITELEDFSEVRREKGGQRIGGTFTEVYYFTSAELASAWAFYKSYRLIESFTKLAYDPDDPAFDIDDPLDADGPTITVRFAKEWGWKWTGPDEWRAKIVFKVVFDE